VAAPDVDVIRWGRERARTVPWRGSRQVALLTPLPGAPVPSLAFVRRCVDTLTARGFTGVVTGALAPVEQRAFLAAGFAEAERLHLLSHDLSGLSTTRSPGARLRRARPRDWAAVLDVDHAAFPSFWQLDDAGLSDAISATPHARFQVAVDDTADRVIGYAISGRSGRNGYFQRLAVDPAEQGRGLGRWLVTDGLRWLARWRVDQCVVNTQWGNEVALGLYERVGFRRLPQGLAVLRRGDDLPFDAGPGPEASGLAWSNGSPRQPVAAWGPRARGAAPAGDPRDVPPAR
jgi:ribosomal protein S18 acetylase RimI-like enzyme